MGRRIVLAVLGLAVILVAVFFLGPRVPVDTTIRFNPSVIGDDPQAYLAREEAAVPNIRDGLDKEIIWANPMVHAKTPLAIVYIHGFSASKGEVRPLPDDIADELDANLFYTRLTGHGQDGAAMAQGSVNAWINDYQEPGASDGVVAIAFISPNFGVKASGAELLTMPWGGQIAELVGGKQRSFSARNALHEKFWTTKYPMKAVLPMAALTELAYAAPVEKAKIPALFIFSDADKVVRPDRTREIAGRWGGPHELVPVDDTGDPDNHVIAGDVLSPQTTAFLTQRIVVWVKALMQQQSS
ncbi:alpha/beta hydrolase [Mesorhizobium sp.]|uniref:alpha/beta hydrolase n=1 Tax=Mesorhizobium sp. TaxID=1871066 RepID=UPI000FE6D35A|nr:alpha/beta hydrolase [Mesorhizobium sp.]RWL52067.1 MAG: alpha/beta hydrolase [Mesorhizobium sp.]